MKTVLNVKERIFGKIKSLLSVRGVLYLFFCVCIFFSFYNHIGSAFHYRSLLPPSAGQMPLEKNVHYTSEFKSNGDPVKKIEIPFCTYERVNHGTLYVSIHNGSEPLYTWSVPTEDLMDNDVHVFKAENKILLDGMSVYYLDIYEEYEGDNSVAVYLASSSGGNILVDGENIYPNRTIRSQWTFENISQRNKYLPVYLTGLALLILFAACMIDLHKYSIHRGVLLVVAIVLFFRMADSNLFQHFATKAVVKDYEKSDVTFSVAPSRQFTSNISVNRSPFNSLEFFIVGESYGDMAVELKNEQTGNVYFNDIIRSQDIQNDERTDMPAVVIKPERALPKGNCLVTIKNYGKEDLVLSALANGQLNILAEQDTYIAHRMAMFIFFLLGFTFIFIATYAIKKFEFHHLYLTAAIPLSICYLILFVPWSQPDTDSHFLAAYRFSNLLMGYGEGFEWYGRESDAEFYRDVWGEDRNPSLKCYSGIAHNFELICEKPDMVELPAREDRMKCYSIFNYLPAVLGLSLGRLLNLGTVLSIYISCLFQLIIYIWATYRAVRRTPFGKGVLAGVSMLPMSLMMGCAISYDQMVILSTINFTASIFFLCKNRDSVAGLIEAAFWAFIIGAVKGGGYLILLPLVLICANKATWRRAVLIIGAGLVSIVLFDKVLQTGTSMFQLGAEEGSRLSAAYALQEPFHFLVMCVETYMESPTSLALSIGGTVLGWLEVTIPSIVIMMLLAAIGIYSIFEKDDILLRRKDKYIMVLIVVIGIISIPAMLLSWTEKGAKSIHGLQGRYYLPLLPLVFMVFTKFSLYGRCRKPKWEFLKNKIILTYGIFSFLAVYYVMKLYLRR